MSLASPSSPAFGSAVGDSGASNGGRPNGSPSAVDRDHLPNASAEIGVAKQESEAGVERILEAVEALLAFRGETIRDYQLGIEAHATAIFEACTFQDITGQRLTKVSRLLDSIQAQLAHHADHVRPAEAAEAERASRGRDQMLNGPALNGPEVSQDDINALFD